MTMGNEINHKGTSKQRGGLNKQAGDSDYTLHPYTGGLKIWVGVCLPACMYV